MFVAQDEDVRVAVIAELDRLFVKHVDNCGHKFY